MQHKKDLDDLNRQKIEKIDEYLKSKKNIPPEHREKLEAAKSKWQEAWARYMDVIMYLETLEI
jgi:hypothetical protein